MTKGTSSITVTTMTVMANLVGAGLLSLPFSLKRAGIIPGTLMMVFVACLNSFSMLVIAKCCEMSGQFTYKGVGKAAFGPVVTTFINVVMSFYTLGSCVSFIVLIGDFLPDLVCESGCDTHPTQRAFSQRYVVVLFIALLILYPLALMRDLSSLKFTTVLSTVSIFYTALMIVVEALRAESTGPQLNTDGGGFGVFVAFPILAVAFTLHYNVPKFYAELKDRSLKRLGMVVGLAFGSVLVCYLGTALGGYMKFGSDTQPDVLQNFENAYVPAIVARIALSLILIGCYPLAFNSFRMSVTALLPDWMAARLADPAERKAKVSGENEKLEKMINPSFKGYTGDAADSEHLLASHKLETLSVESTLASQIEPSRFKLVWRAAKDAVRRDWPHGLLTFALVLISVGVGIGIPNIATVLTYKGALGGSLIVYIFPAWMYFALVQRKKSADAAGGHIKVAIDSHGAAGEETDHAHELVLGELHWTGRDLITTPHGLVAVAATTLGLIMMVFGVLVATGAI